MINKLKRKYGYIYQIINIINGKSYIGKTVVDIKKYIECHFRAYNSNKVLHKAIKKYGKENFTWRTLWEGICNNDHLNNLEIFFIAYYNTYKGDSYNCTEGGDGGVIPCGEDCYWHKSNTTKEERSKRGQNAYKSRLKNGNVFSGQESPVSKTKMSDEKRKEKGMKGVQTRKERYNLSELAKRGFQTQIKNKTQQYIFNNPNSKENTTEKERSKRGQNAYKSRLKNGNVKIGSQCINAKEFTFIDPNNKNFNICGNFTKFCKKNNLSVSKMRNNINKGIIKYSRIKKENCINCINWEVKETK